ncbi:enkurin domain-containing protein 1-like isoform X2 [Saccoglossus kowalevskii]|nr:PREDICTED: enkurin domain-containing protein 1-like isoform X3 [Saccoglossus kowalevskii]XP_006816687.1 PREDICTED: enkurin domain-containing protein 1-like isoform X4 [Saccoglossus kowalevskii]
MLSSPIPADPTYQSSNGWASCDTAPKPRVRPEAESIAEKHKGSLGLLLQLEGQGIYRPPRQKTVESRDYAKENVRKMRQIQTMNRRRKEEEQKKCGEPVKVLPQSEKYKEVSSKLSEHLNQPPPAPRPNSSNYLRAHSRPGTPEISVCGRSPRVSNSQGRSSVASSIQGRSSTASSMQARSSTPLNSRPSTTESVACSVDPSVAESEMMLKKRENVNYIALNARQARYMQQRQSPSVSAVENYQRKQNEKLEHHKRGAVPSYLQSRKKQWEAEEEERRQNIPDPDMPEGHKAMPQKERLETLEVLKQKEKELNNEIQKLPITSATLRARNKKAELETRLVEIEEAIKIFSRQKVFVKIDE